MSAQRPYCADGEGDAGIGLSVVIPYRNEEPNLQPLYLELTSVLDLIDVCAEILFVDDASTDGGGSLIEALSTQDARIRSLRLSDHAGQSAALEAGFRAARGALVATLDADRQNDPADLPSMLAALSDADCVCGIRVDRRDTRAKRFASKVANRVRSAVLRDGVTDVGCSIRVMRSAQLNRIKLFRGGHRFLPALLRIEGARIVEVPVRHRPRVAGRSNYTIARRLGAVWIDLLGVLWWSRRVDRYEVKELSRPRA